MIQKLYDKFVNREMVTYLICGVLTTVVNWIVYGAMWSQHVDYRISTAVAWVVSVVFAFVVNKIFVFQSYDRNPLFVFRELTAFVACRALSGVMEMALMIFMVSYAHINELFSKLVVSAVVLVVNYVFSKLFIFKNQS